MYILSYHLLNTHLNSSGFGVTDLLRFKDLPVGYAMLVVVFLGLLAVALSYPVNFISQVFEIHDLNRDGAIQMSELFACYKHCDVNGDELLTLEEFATGMRFESPLRVVEDFFKFFDKLDGKEDGLMNPSSTAAIFNSLGGKNDGKVTREEFEATFLLIFDDVSKQLLA